MEAAPYETFNLHHSPFGLAERDANFNLDDASSTTQILIDERVNQKMYSMDVDPHTMSPKAISLSVSDVPPEIWRLIAEQVRWKANLSMAFTVKCLLALLFADLLTIMCMKVPSLEEFPILSSITFL